MWRNLNEILHNKQTNTESNILEIYKLDKENKIIEKQILRNQKEIADQLNEYFKNVGKILYNNIEDSTNTIGMTNIETNINSIFLRPVTQYEIENEKLKQSQRGNLSKSIKRKCK